MTAIDAADNHSRQAAAEVALERDRSAANPLDRRLDLARFGWFGVAAIVIAVTAIGFRFTQLDAYVLNAREGEWALDAWSLYTGKPLPAGQDLPTVSPLFLLLESAMFFLFGVTDAIARSLPAIVGLGIVALTFAFRPFVSRAGVIGMALLTAISPSLTFASRTIDPAILIAFLGMLAVIAALRAGVADGRTVTYWTGLFGVAIGGMLAAGPEGISVSIAIVVALAAGAMTDDADGPVARGIKSFASSPRAMVSAAVGFVVVCLLAFSHILANASALGGFLTTFSDWGRMMATQTSTTPTQFFFYATLLYEFLAVVFAIVALVASGRPEQGSGPRASLKPTLFVVWFIAALVLQSLASGRQPDQAILVTLPLVLLGGIGLGQLIDRVAWKSLVTTRDGLLLAAMFGLFFGIVGTATLVARANDPGQTVNSPWLRALFILLVVVLPLSFLIYRETRRSGRARYAGWCALLVVAVLLGAVTIRSATQLAWERADTGTELLAPRVPTEGVRALVDQTLRLSRDLSLDEVSNEDNTGSFGVSIALDPAVEWPFAWYFRDFPEMRVTTPAGWEGADIVIAPTNEGMEEAGYVVQTRTWSNRVPVEFEDLGLGTVLSNIVSSSERYEGYRFLMFRDLESAPAPEQLSIGYTFRLSNQLNPSAGPFDLQTGQSLGPGAALGQLNAPTGIALSSDGQVMYIVDSGNRRIQRFGRDGTFIGSWSAEDDQRLGLGFFEPAGQGASDIVVDADDLIHVADTWNHRVMILDADGQVVRELGRPGELTDTMDSADPSVSPGLFYGPRSVAVTDTEIFVTDTGNERVQVFAPDGTFLRAFGGFGSEPGRLIEPVGIAIGPDGNVYVADTGNARISVFGQDGTAITQIPVPSWQGQASQQNYLRFGTDGVLYLTSPGNGVVQAFDGTDVVAIQGGEAGGSVTAPVGLAVGADGQILVTETSTSQVIEFPVTLPEGFGTGAVATPAATPQPTVAGTPVG